MLKPTFNSRRTVYQLLVTTVLILLSSPVCGQVKNTKKLSCLPPETREALVKRLELFIQLDGSGEFGKQFDLLSRSFIEKMKIDREGYIDFRRREVIGTLLELKLYDMTLHLKEGYVQIPATARTRYKGNVVEEIWLIKAYFQSGEWQLDYTWVDI